ncbi:DUF4381 domain-containing protein [Congregibacter variabilis]|uniref:DUF4381 domain-containing protein n=1 Tax=Congregibacter variabilis TaxID=3081200 RepID=A0ABZ0I5C1_9GAMM|nr:DUF4381 domain-containing protein [Congregibacter sp. IMCC43200]
MEADAIVNMLEPLREPTAVHWWPLAPGWWVLAALILTLAGYGLRRLWLFHLRAAPLRAARRAFADIEATSEANAEQAAALGQLQRRLAIAVAGRKACAGLTGQAWADFLNSLSRSKNAYFDGRLAELNYLPSISPQDCNDALDATRRWLSDLERPL